MHSINGPISVLIAGISSHGCNHFRFLVNQNTHQRSQLAPPLRASPGRWDRSNCPRYVDLDGGVYEATRRKGFHRG